MKNYPKIAPTETVEVIRRSRLSLDKPFRQTMTAKEAIDGNWSSTSHGTMDVEIIVRSGPHSGASAILAGGLRAAYDPRYQRPDRSELCDE